MTSTAGCRVVGHRGLSLRWGVGEGKQKGLAWGRRLVPRKGTCVSVRPSLLPTPRPLPCPASVCRSAILQVTAERLEERTLRANLQERSRSAPRWAVARDGVRGRTLMGTESVAPPSRPAPATAGEACGKACWENGGLSGRRGKGRCEGWDTAGVPSAAEPLDERRLRNLRPDSGEGRFGNAGLGF